MDTNDEDMAAAAHRIEADEEVAAVIPSFVSVYDEQADFVWRNLRRLGVAESALDDALQDVFIVVHRRLLEFEGRSSVRTWLFAILRRVAAEYRRKAVRHRAVSLLDEERSASQASSAFEHVARAQAVARLCDVLDALGDDKREVFILIELEGLSGPEVARLLDINLNTMYTRLRAARTDFSREVARRRMLDDWRSR